MIVVETCSVPIPNTQGVYHNWVQHMYLKVSVAVEVSIDNFIPNRLKAGDGAFILSSWRHKGEKYGRRTLVAR